MFSRVLIANRGEIAVRIERTLRRLGVESVAVYSDADAGAPHVRGADRALRIGPTPAAQSYLDPERILEAARRSGAEAVHPGYGFLSESAGFARACAEAGLAFVGPGPEAMALLGDKVAAKAAAEAAGVPILPGLSGERLSDEEIVVWAAERELPLLVKAAAGGGGKGMRVVERPRRLAGGDRRGAARGARRLRRRPAPGRALPRRLAPHRGPGARRLPRQRGAPRRARVQPAAAPPEGGRGVALAGGRRRAARADGGRRGGPGRAAAATSTPAPSS